MEMNLLVLFAQYEKVKNLHLETLLSQKILFIVIEEVLVD